MDNGYCCRKNDLSKKYRFEKIEFIKFDVGKKVWVTNYNLRIDYPNGTWGTSISEMDFLNNYITIEKIREGKINEILK